MSQLLTDPLTDTQRNGSITGIGIVLGFSLTLTWQFTTGSDPWSSRNLLPLLLILLGIGLQIYSLFTVLNLPPISVAKHRNSVYLPFGVGVLLVLGGFMIKTIMDVRTDLRAPAAVAGETPQQVPQP